MFPQTPSPSHAGSHATQGPWSLPSGWEWALLDPHLYELKSGFACARKDADPSGCPHLRPFNIGPEGEVVLDELIRIPPTLRSDLDSYFLRPGDILFNNTNSVELVGKSAIVDEEYRAAFSNHITRLRVRATDRVVPQWLTFYLRLLHSRGYFSKNCNKWIGQAGFKPTRLAEIAIPLPGTGIQHRIVNEIKALLTEIKAARTIAAGIRSDTDGVMAAALEETVRALDGKLDRVSLGELVSNGRIRIMGGGTPSTLNAAYWSGPLPWVSPKDMKRWIIEDAQDHISQLALDETSARRIPRGAVLVVVRGMILAHTWPIAVTSVDVAINQDMKAQCPDGSLRPEYLGYVLWARSRQVLSVVETSAHGTRRLRTGNLLRVLVPDAPLSVQNETITHLDEVASHLDEMRRLQEQDRECLDQLEQAILECAFRGEL